MKQENKSKKGECRSRNGCHTCRKRRVKCDEVHPQCANCLRLKLDCSYSIKLLWENEARDRGISFGRSKEGRAMNKSSGIKLESLSELISKNSHWVQIKNPNSIFINTTFNEFERPMIESKLTIRKRSSIRLLYSGAVLTTRYLESEIFNYGINKIFPTCICFPGVNWSDINAGSRFNPYLNLVAPLAMKSNILYKTILSVSLKQLYLLGNTNYDYLTIQYKREVLILLPQLIREKKKKKHTDWDDVLATILMLCFADISSDCDSSWIVHLNGAKEFLNKPSLQLQSSPLFKFFSRYFITHEVMGQTAWTENKTAFDAKYFSIFNCDDNDQIDLVLGCSPQLISVVNSISNLGEIYEKLEKDKEYRKYEEEIFQERNHLEDILERLEQNFETPFIDIESTVNIIKISEIKRLTSLVYLYGRIDLENAFHNGDMVANIVKQRYKKIKSITKDIINLIQSLPSVFMSLLWTLFVIGIISVDSDEERYFVLSKLIEMERLRELASVKIARRVVESVWKEKDLHIFILRWKDLIRSKANTISLA